MLVSKFTERNLFKFHIFDLYQTCIQNLNPYLDVVWQITNEWT